MILYTQALPLPTPCSFKMTSIILHGIHIFCDHVLAKITSQQDQEEQLIFANIAYYLAHI